MTPDVAKPARPSRWRRWRIGWLLVAALFSVCAYGTWREYDFRAAIREAKALGWGWDYDDPIEAIRADWKAAFRKATWTGGKRELEISNHSEFEGHASLLRRLAPTSLTALERPQMKDLSTIEGLTSLQRLDFSLCRGLANVDALKGLPTLKVLFLEGCVRLKDVDALKGLSGLQALYLCSCFGLTNVDGLKALPALKTLDLGDCISLPAESIAALKSALPNTKILHDALLPPNRVGEGH